MRQITIIIAVIFILAGKAFAQEKKDDTAKTENKPSMRERFVFGGNIFLQVGTYTVINIAPMAGYYITPKLFSGVSLTYQYYYEKWISTTVSSHIFGTGVFCQYPLIEHIGKDLPMKADFSIISHVEYEALNLDRDFSLTSPGLLQQRYWLHGLLIGGGFKQHVGKRSSINITFLYNLLWDKRTPYTNPLIRIGFYL